MELKLPGYLKYVFLLIGLALTIWLLQTFKAVFVPILFSGLFAFLFLPLCRRLEALRIPRVLAIIICIIIIVVVVGGIIWLLTLQLMSFTSELGTIGNKLNELLTKVQDFLKMKFGIEPQNKSDLIQSTFETVKEKGSQYLGSTVSMTTGALSSIMLVPIYIFCMLYYRDHTRQFMFKFVSPANRTHVIHTLDNIQHVVASYISGLLTVIIIVALLNIFGLLIMGVEYAVFFGIFASILTIIPYIGILIGALLPALYVLVQTGSPVDSVIVIGIFTFVQFLEGNFITPYITGSKVSINPFAAIVALIIGGEVWGAVGMILSIPMIAILKVIFDAYKPTEPLGFLLGDIDEHSGQPGLMDNLWSKCKALFSKKSD